MPEYRLEATEQADELDAEAESLAAQVRLNILRSTNYVLGVVLFAVVLFFAGMSTKLQGEDRGSRCRDRVVLFVGAAIRIATFPVSLEI